MFTVIVVIGLYTATSCNSSELSIQFSSEPEVPDSVAEAEKESVPSILSNLYYYAY